MATKDVAKDALKEVSRARVAEDFDRRLHDRVVATHIIETEGVIDMIVREEDAVEAHEAEPQTLLAMIWWTIDEKHALVVRSVRPQQRRA
jgi:hypothetical protein